MRSRRNDAVAIAAVAIATMIVYASATISISTVTDHCEKSNPFSAELDIDCRKMISDEKEQFNSIERLLLQENPLNVSTLTIKNSLISHLPPIICNFTGITGLNLNDNRLTELPLGCFNRMKNLVELTVVGNRLKFLQDGLFDGMEKLNSVSFEYNEIEWIGVNVFSNYSYLPNLCNIWLEGNKLTVLDAWPFARAQVCNGTNVYLGDNKISKFTNEIGWSFQCGMTPFPMNLDLGGNRITHLIDFLRAFRLASIRELLCFFGTKMHTNIKFQFRHNPLDCDCSNVELMTLNQKAKYAGLLDNLNCETPTDLANEKIVSVRLDKFVCEETKFCPQSCQCFSIPHNTTLKVTCSGNVGLTELPDQLPPFRNREYKYMYELTFSGSSINMLTSRPYLKNVTRSIDLSNTRVTTVTDEAWMDLRNIKNIQMNNNRLTTLSPIVKTLNFSNVKSLSLYGNPLSCECQNVWMKHWLQMYNNSLQYPQSMVCATPNWLTGRTIFSVQDWEHCTDPNRARTIAIATSTSVGVLVVLGLMIFLVVYKLRVLLFTTFKVHPFDRDECDGEKMDHDVFLTCSHEDRLHALYVLQILQSNQYNVCYHEKDFVPGETIADNIIHAVTHSKRALCLVSERFINSSYCVYEFETALDHNVKMKKKRLVALMLERIDLNDPSVPRELKQYLSSHTYVEYWSSNWINNLLYAMPTKKLTASSPSSHVEGPACDNLSTTSEVSLIEQGQA